LSGESKITGDQVYQIIIFYI